MMTSTTELHSDQQARGKTMTGMTQSFVRNHRFTINPDGVSIKGCLACCNLSKGGTRALRDLDLFRPKRDAFACTLTSLDDRFSKKWERNAALPGDRIKTLRKFHDAGIFTWVSLEPTLDVKSSLALVEATHEFVDLFKVGRINYLPMTKTTDWRDYTLRMLDQLARFGARHYIKKDL